MPERFEGGNQSVVVWCGCISSAMEHCFTTTSGFITYVSHFLAVIIVMLDGIQPDPEEARHVTKCGERSSKHVLFIIVVQLDPFCYELIFAIELVL
jgi:hypothetical protein